MKIKLIFRIELKNLNYAFIEFFSYVKQDKLNDL